MQSETSMNTEQRTVVVSRPTFESLAKLLPLLGVFYCPFPCSVFSNAHLEIIVPDRLNSSCQHRLIQESTRLRGAFKFPE